MLGLRCPQKHGLEDTLVIDHTWKIGIISLTKKLPTITQVGIRRIKGLCETARNSGNSR